MRDLEVGETLTLATMPEFWYYVYQLSGPDGHIRYVGHTGNPAQRLARHASDAHSPRLRSWVTALGPENISMHIVARCRAWDDVLILEESVIALRRYEGADLLNVAHNIGLDPDGSLEAVLERSLQVLSNPRSENTRVLNDPLTDAAKYADLNFTGKNESQVNSLCKDCDPIGLL